MPWIASVSHDILSHKGIKVEDYVNDLQDLSTPLEVTVRSFNHHKDVPQTFCSFYEG